MYSDVYTALFYTFACFLTSYSLAPFVNNLGERFKILDLPKPSKVDLFSPIVRGRKGEYRKEILNFKKQGFEKIRIDGKIYDIDNAPNLNKKIKRTHAIYTNYFRRNI